MRKKLFLIGSTLNKAFERQKQLRFAYVKIMYTKTTDRVVENDVRDIILLNNMRVSSLLFKPKASEVLTAYLKQCNEPPWTSYFIKLKDVENDQYGQSHFNWTLSTGTNYHILRTGCYPYLKYHCSKREYQNLSLEDKFFRFLKVINLGLPMLFYGIAATRLISHKEIVVLDEKTSVCIYFLYAEDKGSRF